MADYYLFPEQTYNKDGFFGLIPIKYTEFNLFIKNTSGYSLVPIINSSGEVTNLISKGQVRFNLISNLSSNYNLISGVKPLEDLTGKEELQLIQYPEEFSNTTYGSNISQIINYPKSTARINSLIFINPDGVNLIPELPSGYNLIAKTPKDLAGIHRLILYLLAMSLINIFRVGGWRVKARQFVNTQMDNYASVTTSKADYILTHIEKDT